MAVYLQCFNRCFGWSGVSGAGDASNSVEQPRIALDTMRMGTDAVIVKGGRRICGTGGGLANTSIVQDKAYFEIKLQSSGIWGVGLALGNAELDRVPLGEDASSWVLRHTGEIVHNNKVLHASKTKVEEGDIIGVSYDHVELNFFVNGKSLNCPVIGIRGTIFPLLYGPQRLIVHEENVTYTLAHGHCKNDWVWQVLPKPV